jgi:hypothetical protein
MTRTATNGEPADVVNGSVDSARELMANARPDAPAGALLARARVLGAMSGAESAAGAVGRFRVLERLGAGGMGVVYEAYDPDLARGVALKLVNVAAKDREVALAAAKARTRLSHPNVVPICDVGLAHEQVYLVMELVRGKTLRQAGSRTRLCERTLGLSWVRPRTPPSPRFSSSLRPRSPSPRRVLAMLSSRYSTLSLAVWVGGDGRSYS